MITIAKTQETILYFPLTAIYMMLFANGSKGKKQKVKIKKKILYSIMNVQINYLLL